MKLPTIGSVLLGTFAVQALAPAQGPGPGAAALVAGIGPNPNPNPKPVPVPVRRQVDFPAKPDVDHCVHTLGLVGASVLGAVLAADAGAGLVHVFDQLTDPSVENQWQRMSCGALAGLVAAAVGVPPAVHETSMCNTTVEPSRYLKTNAADCTNFRDRGLISAGAGAAMANLAGVVMVGLDSLGRDAGGGRVLGTKKVAGSLAAGVFSGVAVLLVTTVSTPLCRADDVAIPLS